MGAKVDHYAEDADRVMTLPEWCAKAGISLPTGRRLIKAGEGPAVTCLSARRIGIRVLHHRQWLDSRIEPKARA